jgi:intracellular sulfur oxidation DsrE/DsrF family protein
MSMLQHIAKPATIGAIAVLLTAPFAAAEEGGQYWVPGTTANPAQYSEPARTSFAPYPRPRTTNGARHMSRTATQSTRQLATPHTRKRSSLAAMARSVPDPQTHRLILQVNTNDPPAMNLALNNATNVAQHYKELGDKVKIEVVTFGPGLHMLRADTSPVKARIEQMALSTPEVSFKACGNTQEKMHEAEHKDIPIIPQAQVVSSGVVRVMELQEKGWTYVKP